MKAMIGIGSETVDGKRLIHFDEQLSHHINESELQQALDEARQNFWKIDPAQGTSLGAGLYRFLNGSGCKVDALLEESLQEGQPLTLFLDIPYELNALPFELLNNGRFLAQIAHPRTFIIRKVAHRKSRQKLTADKRPLKVLFMACSPVDLDAKNVLSFEKEEELILSRVEEFAVDMIIEDSGSVHGLFKTLHTEGPFDVVHITGHAGHEAESGPVFYMEDDTGGLDRVTPERLWSEALKDNPPQLLFLSGCSTGKADKVMGAESFAHQMVDRGISRVLGWGLPVSDVGATRLTTELYRYLGMGRSMVEAVNEARKALQEEYHPWPLLRLFSDGAPLSAFIASGQLRHWPKRKTTYKTLQDRRVRVLEHGFIGRRREIQQGVRVLKGIPDEHGDRRFGVLIRGPAGIGKSCLAGKLIERFKNLEPVVVHGKLTRLDIVSLLRRLFDRRGIHQGMEILKSDQEYEDKIKELFRSAFLELPVMIYLDDFEQNLVQQNGYWEVDRDVVPVLRPILQALDWNDESCTRLMITSRYPFRMQYEGEDLGGKLADITLLAFRDADLEKKTAELPKIAGSEHREMYLTIGAGNPRLMEWLEVIARDEEKYDLESLQKELEGKSEEYIREYLADIMAGTEGEEFSDYMKRAAVYRRPVEASAYAGIGDPKSLEKGVDLTLFEKERIAGHEPVYWVMPVIREQQWNKLPADEQKKLHEEALRWYEERIEAAKDPDYEYLQEAVHHALSCDRVRSACKHAIDLGANMKNLLLYRDKVILQQSVADCVTDTVLAEVKKEKDERVATLLNNLGSTYHDLGDAKKAIKYYEKALEIDRAVLGDKHSNVAVRFNNIGAAYRVLGDAKKAIAYYEQALEIDRAIFGDKHPNIAVSYNNIGLAYRVLGDAKKAIAYYKQALEIDRTVFWDKHPNVAIRYNNIGEAYRNLGDAKKAIAYYKQALEIYREVFGDKHPNVATIYNNLGAAYSALGDAKKAIKYYEQALEIDREVFGDKHPDTAIDFNNLGAAYHNLGDAKKAIAYYEKAMQILKTVYGNDHPSTQTVANNLSDLLNKLKRKDQDD